MCIRDRAGFLALVVLIYVGVLYDTQVVNYDKYIAQSIRSIAREEKVAASRGVITDRTGRALVTSRSTYNLTFDSSLLKADEDENEAILRLVKLCQANGCLLYTSGPFPAAGADGPDCPPGRR